MAGTDDWRKASIISDPGGLIERQRARLALRAAETRARVEASAASAAELALTSTRASTGASAREVIEPEAPVLVNESLKDRVINAAASFVSCLGMEANPSTDRLKRLLDAIEDLPKKSSIRIQLESIVSRLIACRDFKEGKLIFEELSTS